MRLSFNAILICTALALVSCVSTEPKTESPSGLTKVSSELLCESAVAEIRVDHSTARINECDVLSESRFRLTLQPEKATDPQGETINNSPWYGFRVDPKQTGHINFELAYENGTHRYRPKLSYDGVTWNTLPETNTPNPRPAKFIFRMEMDNRPFYISAQEIFTPKAHDLSLIHI